MLETPQINQNRDSTTLEIAHHTIFSTDSQTTTKKYLSTNKKTKKNDTKLIFWGNILWLLFKQITHKHI